MNSTPDQSSVLSEKQEAGPWSEMARALELPNAKTIREVIEHAKWLVASHHEMCGRLQASVQKHRLGLGGERIDVLVTEALDAAVSAAITNREALSP